MKFTFNTTLERGDDELELRVTYELNPYIPATHLQPAEGGDCEIISAKFAGVDAASLPAPLSDAEWDALLIECEERAQDDAETAAADYADWKYGQAEDRHMMDKYEGQIA
jgi:hypothetical protein